MFDKVNQQALQPYLAETITAQVAIDKAQGPIKDFMLSQTRSSDLELFMRLSKRTDIATPDQAPLTILVPAFVTSELKTAFQIGFMIFIPFLIIDLVVASVLMAMGMMMLSPLIISLPFKIMLFVLLRKYQPERVLEELQKAGFEGKVLRTSLSPEQEKKLQEALSHHVQAQPAA